MSFEYKDSWFEGSNFASASARVQRYFKIDSFTPEFAPPISTPAYETFYPEVKFNKYGDKFGWVKYWQMTLNSPKFSIATILCYTPCDFMVSSTFNTDNEALPYLIV